MMKKILFFITTFFAAAAYSQNTLPKMYKAKEIIAVERLQLGGVWRNTWPADGGGGGSVNSVSGTANRITSTGGANPVLNIPTAFEDLFPKTVSNGLTRTGANITLGSATNLSQNTNLGVTSGTTLTLKSTGSFFGESSIILGGNGGTASQIEIVANNSGVNPLAPRMLFSASTGNSYYGVDSFKIFPHISSGNRSIIRDTRVNKTGLQYENNYSSSFVDLSLVHKKYVDSTQLKTLADSAFDVVRPTVTGTVSLFDKISSTQLRISDLKNTGSVTWTKDSDGNLLATAAGGGGGSIAIGGAVTGATAGRLALFGSNGFLQQNAALLFDSSAGRLQSNIFRGSAGDGDVIVEKGDGTRAFRSVTFNGWSDAVSSTHFQVGEFTPNVVFAGRSSGRINRLMLDAGTTHITATTDYADALVPTGILQVDDGINKLLNVTEVKTIMNTQIVFAGKQTINSSTSSIVNNNVYNVFFNPATVMAAHTINLTADAIDGTEINIFFGGLISAGSPVVTSLTIQGLAGHTIYQALTPTTANGGDVLTYVFNGGVWYRKK